MSQIQSNQANQIPSHSTKSNKFPLNTSQLQ